MGRGVLKPAAARPLAPAADYLALKPTAPQPLGPPPRVPTGASHDPLPWSDVARGRKPRPTKPLPPTSADADFSWTYKLRHHNAAFPRQNDVFALACRIYTFLAPFRTGNCSLREAHDLAVGDQRFLRDDLAQDIVTLCDLLRQACLLRSGSTLPSRRLLDQRRPGRIRPSATARSTVLAADGARIP